MIITQKKPIEELMAMLEGVTKVALVGCGSCATACATGGEKEIAELLGRKPGTVHQQVRRGRMILKEELMKGAKVNGNK